MSRIKEFYDRLGVTRSATDQEIEIKTLERAPKSMDEAARKRLVIAMIIHHKRRAEAETALPARQVQYMAAQRKSVGLAIVLALLLGPIGVLYAGVTPGAILILTAFGLGASLNFVLVFIPIWIISIITAPIVVTRHNDRTAKMAQALFPD